MKDDIETTNNENAKPACPIYPDTKLLKNGGQQVLNTAENLSTLCEHIGFKPTLNKMNYSVHIDPEMDPYIQTYNDLKSALISEASKSGLPKSAIEDHLHTLCEKNSIHPIQEWIERDSWDGVKRIELVLKALNFREVELSTQVMLHWLVSAIAALYEPRFSTKITPILQGGQSWTKTAAIDRFCNILNVQGTAFLTGKNINPNSRDSIQKVLSSWIVELGEFESTSKAESGVLKAFFSDDSDTVRFAYTPQLATKRRQTVFIGSVNESEFLTDQTGNKRYMVLPLTGPTDMDSLNSILGWEFHKGSVKLVDESKLRQFWLEVKSLYESGHGWVLPSSIADQAEELNKEYLVTDPIEEKFDKCISFDSYSVKIPYNPSDICELIGLNPIKYASQVGKFLTTRYPDCKTRVRIDGNVKRVYMLPKIRLKKERV